MPLYREVMSAVATGDAPADGAALAARLNAANEPERRKLLEGIVRATLAKVLKLAPDRIEPRRTFGAMGLGSLDAMELRNRLEEALGRSLSATLAWNYPTVDALVAHLGGDASAEHGTAASEAAPVAAVAPVSADLGKSLREVATLSEEEALLALRNPRTKAKR
jgi:myxalamid-type polyketide synthase MxaE and MxaD